MKKKMTNKKSNATNCGLLTILIASTFTIVVLALTIVYLILK